MVLRSLTLNLRKSKSLSLLSLTHLELSLGSFVAHCLLIWLKAPFWKLSNQFSPRLKSRCPKPEACMTYPLAKQPISIVFLDLIRKMIYTKEKSSFLSIKIYYKCTDISKF